VPAEPLGQRAESKTAIEPMATPRAAAEAIAQNEEPSARLVPVISMPSAPPLAAPSEANVFGDRAPHDLVAGPNDENLVPGAKPHPITAEHQRLYREVGIVDAAWDALEARDFVKARLLIDEHRRRYAGENSDVDEGMSLLADCMQHPNAETRGRAQRFYDEVTYSTARRRIRRWCLATDVAELGGSSL
jgi:hypothetical protein